MRDRMRYWIGMDIGGTTARMGIRLEGRTEIMNFSGTGCTLNSNSYETCRERYRDITWKGLRSMGLEVKDCAGICVAASGIDNPAMKQQCRGLFLELGFSKDRLLVINDCEVLLHLKKEPGAVLLAGTGSIAMARHRDGTIVRRGGWGNLLSDEGSAFDIGVEVLRAAVNHLDGRLPCPALYSLFYEAIPIREPLALNAYLLKNCANKAEVARLAPLVEAAAGEGDVAALDIIERTSGKLCSLLESALAQSGETVKAMKELGIPVVFWGSVMVKNERIRERTGQLLRSGLGLDFTTSQTTALEYAVEAAKLL
ncbi:hypothetical protein GPL15_22215 [Clostridium sp. MCC353]|uniref:BadF/BadG/BcrA/BcrD ATPase family protein n=1 Tax=Clostridium sp. MCC353 TaxID=2592646 RepID=UPI001C027794|nr:BadF/BadG/BcrA/BcrD ATPase family protein [Clostridium sp. MCC353]MBT9779196.1 hypothetical protein [Clostridium sp. MCC353]